MALTILDLDEAQKEGERRAQRLLMQAQTAYYAPDLQRQVGNMWRQVKRIPGMAEFYKAQYPADYEKMEKHYGKVRRV